MMYDTGSSSSTLSSSCGSIDDRLIRPRQRVKRIRQDSITSVSTNPDEDAYVMVLQNRQGLYANVKSSTSSLKEENDVKFLVGEDQTPVNGVRSILTKRNRLLGQLITSFEKNKKAVEIAKSSKVKKTLNKLNKLSCINTGLRSGTTADDKRKKLVVPMKAFDSDCFQRFINYLHTGTLTIDSSTVIGLLNAAYMFDVPEVQQACWNFALGCFVRTDNLYDLLSSAQRYSEHKMTIDLIKTMETYTNDHPEVLLHSRSLENLADLVFSQAKQEVM